MDQIVKYTDVKAVTDVVKTFASLPVIPTQDPETGAISFTIADFEGFKAMLSAITEEYSEDFVVTESNVSVYEKDAAALNKLIKFIKDGAKDYVMGFAKELLGVTTGKNRYDGQVQQCEAILKTAYDRVHAKTVAFREAEKAKAAMIDAIDAETLDERATAPAPKFVTYVVNVPEAECAAFEEYLKTKGYKAAKGAE